LGHLGLSRETFTFTLTTTNVTIGSMARDFPSYVVLLFIIKYWNVKTKYSAVYDGRPKVSSHFEYLENRSCGLDVTWQPIRGDLTVHP